METNELLDELENENPSPAETPHQAEDEVVAAWELVDAGRYRPRRIRGSYRGRELG